MNDKVKVIHLLEDDYTQGDLLQVLLETEGYKVWLFSNVETFNSNKKFPDLNLLDIFLPDGDGRDVCRELRQNVATQHIPSILMSVYTEPLGTEIAHDFIQKPFGIEDLIFKIERQLN